MYQLITLEQQLQIVLYMLLAGFLSMVIGIERETRNKPAGMRTHMLVGIGACIFAAISVIAFPNDPARIAASIVSGIGFIGAGVIWRGDDTVHDLTTASSIWVTAGVGIAAGIGAWFLAICITIVTWLVLRVLRSLRNRL